MIKAEWTNKDALDLQPTCNQLATAEPKTGRDCTDFVRWLMDEVMDEENWTLNAVDNGEIICRKLKKLGLLDVVDGYYVETQETGWIPVSERLPKECDGRVLVSKEDGQVTTGLHSEFSNVWYIGDMCGVGGCKVIAWMPLPEPYREDGE